MVVARQSNLQGVVHYLRPGSVTTMPPGTARLVRIRPQSGAAFRAFVSPAQMHGRDTQHR